jgi:hypothetical protein
MEKALSTLDPYRKAATGRFTPSKEKTTTVVSEGIELGSSELRRIMLR